VRRVAFLVGLVLVACSRSGEVAPSEALPGFFGPIAFDVTATSALLWARVPGTREITFELVPADARPGSIPVVPGRDSTARVRVDGLHPATEYAVRVGTVSGHFRTAPPPDAGAAIRIVWGGDVAGQNVCRDASTGFPILGALAKYAPDVFIGLGDMIYADNTCDAVGRYGNAQLPGGFGPAFDSPGYWAHWRYARGDPGLAKVLSSTAYVPVWDDHEVVNDFGPQQDMRAEPPYPPGVHLMPIGLQAFLDYNPVSSDSGETPERLYRTLRLGRHVELFILDTRQYRDANAAPDAGPAPPDEVGAVERDKSMLGREQLTWLERKLEESDATWKVIVSSVPLGLPTGSKADVRGRDGWAGIDQPTGFARERDRVLRFLAERGIATPIWITTDVHLAEVFVHWPFPDRADFRVIEAVSGPLNAGLGIEQPPDPTLHSEVRYVHAAPADPPLARWDEALRYFNFGALEVAADGRLTVRIVGVDGATLYEESFAPSP
jgi:alkaline phosphatase D